MADKQTVAVLGAGGIMGLAMARNLARDGLRARVEPLAREGRAARPQDGAEVADSPARGRGAGPTSSSPCSPTPTR